MFLLDVNGFLRYTLTGIFILRQTEEQLIYRYCVLYIYISYRFFFTGRHLSGPYVLFPFLPPVSAIYFFFLPFPASFIFSLSVSTIFDFPSSVDTRLHLFSLASQTLSRRCLVDVQTQLCWREEKEKRILLTWHWFRMERDISFR